MLEPAAQPPMTKEQAIRGKDAEIPWVLLVTGYGEDAVARIADEELAAERFEKHGGAAKSVRGRYRLDYSLTDRERALTGRGAELEDLK